MKKTLKWLFVAPFLFFGVWLIALFSAKFREDFIWLTNKVLKVAVDEYERSL